MSLLFLGSVAMAQDTTRTEKKGVDIYITQSPKIIINVESVTDNTCNGEAKGAIDISASGGYPPYNYYWSHGAETQDVTGLEAGRYRVAVYDDFSCSDTLTIEIKEPPKLTAEIEDIQDIVCFGYNQGEIDISVSGGVPPYSYSWSNGSTNEDLTGVPSGEYSVLITDANNCQEIVTAKIKETPLIVRSIDDTENIKCFGDATGSIDITVDGGVPPYNYNWSNGAGTQDIDSLTAGTYEVTVTDSEGCTEVYEARVFEPEELTVEFDNVRDVRCYGDNGGAVNIEVLGGVTPYSYDWSNGATTQDITGVEAGNYSVSVVDANGCSEELDADISQPERLDVTLVSSEDVSYYGGEDGAIDIEVEGGNPPYKYKWNTGSEEQDIDGLKSGNYNARVSDASGCSKIINVTLEQPEQLSVKIDKTVDIKCNGDESGEIYITVIGGVEPYQYNWNNGATSKNLSGVPAGEYSVEITDANDFKVSIDTALKQPPAFESSIVSVTDILCSGEVAGAVDIEVSGGVAPYKYFWNNGMITQDINDVAAGDYSVRIIDANRCEIRLDTVITQPDELIADFQNVENILCHGDSTGSIDVSVAGGVEPYSYEWSNGATSQNLEEIGAGLYRLTVTDANDCAVTIETEVEQPEPLVIREGDVENIDCFGNSTGLINLTVSGGVEPYNYEWSNGASTQNISGLTAGEYAVTITDANGCVVTYNRELTEPTELQASLDEVVDNLCFSDSKGEVNISVDGGVSPYQYNWSTGSTAQDLVDVVAGRYEVRVTDQNGCLDTLSATVEEAPQLEVEVESTDILCQGESTGAIDLTVSGGVAPYTYNWSNGATTQDISEIPQGQYSVVIEDANGCSEIRDVLITEPPKFVAILESQTDIKCYGQSTGAINVRVSGGVTPYEFEWSNGATTEDISSIPAGSYTLTATDANGCVQTIATEITQPSEVLFEVNSVTDVKCYGDQTGAVDISITGGVGPYAYQWNNNATTQDLVNVPAGQYSVKITENNGCENIIEAEVTQPEPLVLNLDTVGHVSCFGNETGLINISVSGGVAPYEYSWSNGATTEDIANVGAGRYSVTVTDANGCVQTGETVINEPPPFVASVAEVVNIKCNGNETGSISLNVRGGVQPYVFEWSNGASSQNLQNLAAGTYSAVITDANGCVQEVSATITEPQPLVVDLISASDVTCFGGTNGNVDIYVEGGTTPYTYQWSNGATTQDLVNVPAGTYSLTVTDRMGCADANVEVTIVEPDELVASFVDVTDISTFGLNSGAIDITVGGGVPPYKYSWSNGATTQDISEIPAGNYSVRVVDAQNCEKQLQTVVNQPPPLQVSVSSVINIQCNDANTGAINVDVTGGVMPYTFEWSNGDSVQSLIDVPAGDYSLTVTDANGIKKVVNSTISEPSAINVKVDKQVDILCFGESTGEIAITVTGGVAPYAYRWSNGSTSQDLNNIPAGQYDLVVTDKNGCSEQLSLEISEPNQLQSRIASTENIKCFGDQEGEIRLEVTGGEQPYRYKWSNGANTQNIAELPAGNYSVVVSDANGCSNTLEATISEPPRLVAGILNVSNNACFGEESGAIEINVSGGVGRYTYNWSNGDTTANISGLAAGMYDVIVRDSLGCEKTLEAEITQPEELIAEVANVTDIDCNGNENGAISVDVEGGTKPYEYIWSNGSTTQDLRNIPAGDYELTISDQSGCSITVEATVSQPDVLALVEDNVENNLCYGAEEGLIDITVSGGVTPYDFTWSNGEKSEDLINVISDTYSVNVKDANGCVQTLETEVTQPDPLVLEVDSVNNVNCAGDETGYLSVVASGGVAPYSYSWNNGNRDQTLQGARAGIYLATVTDANGCETTIEAEITEPPTMIATIDAITDIQCFGDSTGAVYVTAQEGVEPYTFEWSNGATTPDITGLKAGSYRLKITQGNGCITYLDAEVVEPSPFNASVASVNDVNCYGDLDGAIDIDVTGGVEPYNYSWSNGAESQDIANVRADDYSVLITDANGCLISKNTTIQQPPKLRVVIDSVRNVKCCGDTSGAIFISVEGGEGPYQYEWSNGATTQDIENLELGKYTVTVTDARGCTVDALDEQDVDLYEEVVTTGKFTTRDIQFDVAKSTIRPESFRVVNKIATLMKEHPDLAFRIDGHTDADGSAESNLRLSQDRAESIKAALIKFGIAETRLKTKGWGESRPIASNATQEGKQQNRRVEFISLTGTLSGDLVENPDFSLDEEEDRED